MNPLGSCGETSETTAARLHGFVAVLYMLAAVSLVGALAVECIMIGWHRASVRTHRERATKAGE